MLIKSIILYFVFCLFDSFSLSLKAKKSKVVIKGEASFTRFSTKYFRQVLSAMSDHQKSVIDKYRFRSLLMFDSNCVAKKLAVWIAHYVDVHDILHLPIGGLEFRKDRNVSKQFILSKYAKTSLPSVRFFGDQFINKDNLTDDKVITSFFIVALSCFLCANSCLLPSTKYLTIFEDVDEIKSYDWSKFVYD
uniref:DUF1985 domain-containing protein n=1 Tax=Oryza meridionalis TaxID=40149 RepID=A0A0E0ERL2_9ORYZ